MKGALVLLLVVGLAVAMVPKERRDVETEITEETQTTKIETSSRRGAMICQKQTPCLWELYDKSTYRVLESIVNTYCVCSEDTVCTYTEDDTATTALVYHCRTPEPESTTELS